jgi:hypothetical protein
MKNEAKKEMKAGRGADVVLQEIWRIKDTLSESYGHDVHRLFAETRKHEKQSGHPLVSLSDLRKQSANEPQD